MVSVGGAALWLIPGVRTALSATRSTREPAQWAGLGAGLGAVAGLTGSSLLAGVGGVSQALFLQVGDPASGGINLTVVALAAVLLGGVSIFGRRGGLLGTVLGVVVIQTALFLVTARADSAVWFDIAIGGVAVLGLGVSRALESITGLLNRRAAGS